MNRFGDLEAVVMDVLWQSEGPQSVRQVLERLPPGRNLAYTTVMTVLDNLHRKGFLDRDESGRAYLYWPRQTREAYVAELMREALDDVDDRGAALLHFVRSMSPDETRLLRRVMRGRPSG